MTINEVLVAAKGYLLNYGWHQGSLGGRGGPACARGALHMGSGGTYSGSEWDAYLVAERALCQQVGPNLPSWNDAPDRTLDDVIAAIDKAILATAPIETPEPVTV